ncbi:hypothetical protein NQ317_014652, partial [Molorchus minor]
MSNEDSLKARQNNEFEALQMNIQLGSHYSLKTILTSLYNNCCSIPKILLENAKGLSTTVVVELLQKLEQKAAELKGEEMIFQLAQYVQEFLHRHNKPTSKSFYDEMLQRQKEKEQQDLQAKQIEQDRQRQYMIKEVQRRQEILKSEVRLRRENRQNSDNDDEFDTNRRYSYVRRRNNSSTESSDESLCQQCEHRGTTTIEFGIREIQRGRCIKHSMLNHVAFSAIDTDTGELVIVTEWNINLKNKTDLPYVQRQISSIEQELNYLTKLRHINLASYYNLKHQTTEDNVTVYLLKEFIYGSNCLSLFLSQNIKVDIEFLKHIARGVLMALDYLHRNNVVHKEIKHSCVYLSDTDDVEIPSLIQSDLYDLLTRCLAKDESDRYTTTQLLNHAFFQKNIVHFSPKHVAQEVAIERNISPEMVQNDLLLLSQCCSNGQSRINSEFEFLQHLGKGAFGDVIKVRNKLDGGYYAIKRIQLNPKNKTLTKKIVREVKLLSRLNHENVVRYYNSWIETATIKEEIDSSSNSSSVEQKRPKVIRRDEFTLNDHNIEALAPPIKNVEVSITYDSKSQAAFDGSSDDESSDEDEAWGAVYCEDSDSDGIEFEHDSASISKDTSSSDSSIKNVESPETTQEIVKQIDFMYIQMEFCEKSTLRTAIDDNLYLDEDRLWRLFREIVEGLAHIHQQGMIHRDLKPVNIFLDSEDHVKIGDFGLATTSIKSRQNEYVLSKSAVESEREETVDESKTGLVGTALYVAPEICTSVKVVYNQKVDIYSLGIILFEMCYKPLDTSMERIKILTKLRLKETVFPEDFVHKQNEKQLFLIRWLLNHDISKRPTSQELLQSEYIPPPVLEERELQELVRHTLSNPHLKGYKYLIASCFKQSVTAAQDITYDKDPSAPNIVKPVQLYDFVKQICVKTFKQHGGQNISTPLLMPKSRFYEGLDSCAKLMTHFGSIVSLPHDLRVPFARYVAWNNISLLRRYSIERVYREKKVFGFQPRELYECAFDIVSPSKGSLMSDAEILYIVYEIINEIPGVKNKHFLIKLNHTSLLKAILLHCGIKDRHQEVYNMISDVKEGKIPKYQLQTYFITLGLSDNVINILQNFFNSEFEISKAMNQFQTITKKEVREASQLAKEALQDLKLIGQKRRGLWCEGMICQFVCELKKKHKHNNMEVLAAGGRYDSMIAWYRTIMEQSNMLGRDVHQSAVGISIALDRLVQALQKEQSEELPKINFLDVVVCSVGSKQMTKEKTKILRSLWAAGIRSSLVEATSIEEIQDQLNELKVSHVIMLKDNDQGTVRVRSWDKDRSESKTNYGDRTDQEADVDVLFVTVDKIRSQLDNLFKKLTGFVIVFGLSIDSNVIRTLASYLEFDSEYHFQKSVENVIE